MDSQGRKISITAEQLKETHRFPAVAKMIEMKHLIEIMEMPDKGIEKNRRVRTK